MKTNTDSTITLRPGDSATAFVQLLEAGVSKIQEAAHMLKRLVDSDPGAIEQIREINPAISPNVLTKLLLVAEGHLMPQLLLNSAPAFKRLQSLPFTIQQQALKRGAVDLVTDADSGETLRVRLTDLEPKHIAQVFDGSGIRSVDEQRAYLKRTVVRVRKATDDDYPWLVKKDRVVVHRPCELTKKDVLRILEEIS